MNNIVIIANFCREFNGLVDGRFLYLAEMMSIQGMSVELITSDFSHASKQFKNAPAPGYKSKLTYCHEPGYIRHVGLKRLWSHHIWGRNVAKYVKSLPKPDCIYCAIPSLTAAVKMARYCKRKRIKFIIDIQDLWPEATFMLIKNRILQKISLPMKWYVDYAYASADKVIAVSETYVNRALQVNHKVSTGLAIYLGNNGEVFDKARLKYAMPRKDKEFWVCYIGTHSYSYDLKIVIDAIALLNTKHPEKNNIRFVSIGDGPLKNTFQKYAEQKSIKSSFMGRKPCEVMVGIMCSCNIVVNPIVKGAAQSITNKVGDYALSSLPVINTQECLEYRNLVDAYGCGINCENGNVEQLAEAIWLLMNNSDLREKMGEASRRLGIEKFDRRNTYQRIVDFII